MKAFRIVAGFVIIIAGAIPCSAQPAHSSGAALDSESAPVQPGVPPRGRLVRGDVSALVGWYLINKGHLDSEWHDDTVVGSLGAGWYWTEHLKTEVQYSATSDVRHYTSRPILFAGSQVFAPTEYTFSTRRVSLGQLYQFGRNEWFHPYVGGGVDVIWQRTREEDYSAYYFDPASRQGTLAGNRRTHPTRTDVEPGAFAAAGFKGYVSRRAFIVLDGRLTFSRSVDEVMIRIGVGADF